MKVVSNALFVLLSALILTIHVRVSAVTPIYFESEGNKNTHLRPVTAIPGPLQKDSVNNPSPRPFISEGPKGSVNEVSSLKKYPQRPGLSISSLSDYAKKTNSNAAKKSPGILHMGLGFLLLSIARISRGIIKKD